MEDYLKDYFEREIKYVRLKLIDVITRATGDAASTHKTPGLAALSLPPILRFEKLKSMSQIIETVGNVKFIGALVSVIRDTLARMLVIAQGDPRLPTKVIISSLLTSQFLAIILKRVPLI